MIRPPLARILAAALLLAAAAAEGCASKRVHPWDRDLLAQVPMRLVPYPMIHAVDDHVYFSKEGATGGDDVSGGGCGCN